MDQQLSSYNYDLPPELIAQNPVTPRDRSRLLVVDSPTHHCHGHFYELPQWLRPGDLLVLNNTQVIPARLYGQKSTGAPVEILLLEEKSTACWLALVKPGKRFKIGSEILFSPNGLQTGEQPPLKATVIDRDPETGGRILQFHLSDPAAFWRCLDQYGEIPFPPYVTDSSADVSQYQTIYAQRPGAVAAPTAGLHFTPELFATLAEKGIQTAELTLHVGVGTFRPVEVEDVKTHQMHQEWIDVNAETVEKIRQTKANGDRIIAVGTTAVRALEGAIKEQRKKLSQSAISNLQSPITPYTGQTDLFIYPGYQWQVVDGLITNFHLPCSSLLMLVSALIGRQRLLALYQDAIMRQYRFYSFGDAMLILPEACRVEKC